MKRSTILLSLLALCLFVSSASAQLKVKQGDELFIKAKSENLRLSPGGSVICKLPQGAKVIGIQEEGNWVAVHLVGYIWKKSLSESQYDIPGFTLRSLHILVSSRKEADEIIQLLKGGEDFKKLAKERSKGPNATKGGDLGVINKGDLMEKLDKAINSLSIGSISDVIKTDMGYHIFKRIE